MSGESLLSGLSGTPPNPIHVGLGSLGMGKPLTRLAVGIMIGATLVWAIRPEIAFDKGGNPLPLTLFSDPGDPSTPLPWYFLMMIPGIFFAWFV